MAEITVNGRKYEAVTLDDVTLDEADIVCTYAKVSFDKIFELEGFWPGLTKGLIHIAIARVELDESEKDIKQVVGRLKVTDLEQVFTDISEEVETLPPPTAPDVVSTSAGSGEGSSTTGEPPPADREANGSGSRGSATGSVSDRLTSAA